MFWKPRVIAREVNTRKRKIKEALVIHKIGKDKLLNQDTEGKLVAYGWTM